MNKQEFEMIPMGKVTKPRHRDALEPEGETAGTRISKEYAENMLYSLSMLRQRRSSLYHFFGNPKELAPSVDRAKRECRLGIQRRGGKGPCLANQVLWVTDNMVGVISQHDTTNNYRALSLIYLAYVSRSTNALHSLFTTQAQLLGIKGHELREEDSKDLGDAFRIDNGLLKWIKEDITDVKLRTFVLYLLNRVKEAPTIVCTQFKRGVIACCKYLNDCSNSPPFDDKVYDIGKELTLLSLRKQDTMWFIIILARVMKKYELHWTFSQMLRLTFVNSSKGPMEQIRRKGSKPHTILVGEARDTETISAVSVRILVLANLAQSPDEVINLLKSVLGENKLFPVHIMETSFAFEGGEHTLSDWKIQPIDPCTPFAFAIGVALTFMEDAMKELPGVECQQHTHQHRLMSGIRQPEPTQPEPTQPEPTQPEPTQPEPDRRLSS